MKLPVENKLAKKRRAGLWKRPHARPKPGDLKLSGQLLGRYLLLCSIAKVNS